MLFNDRPDKLACHLLDIPYFCTPTSPKDDPKQKIIMKKLIYLLAAALLLTACVKENEKPPNTDDLPKRIKSLRVYDHNFETQRMEYFYEINNIIKAHYYTRAGQNNDWEMVNELLYFYDLPKVTVNINYNFLGTWTPTAKMEYIIEEGKIQQMDEFTFSFGEWRLDESSSYHYENDALVNCVVETIRADTIRMSRQEIYKYSEGQITDRIVNNLEGHDWILSKYYKYENTSGLTKILGYQSDSTLFSQEEHLLSGELITKKETFELAPNGSELEKVSTENFKYFQSKYLIYSDIQTSYLFQHTEYGYEHAEGNAAWFHDPQEKMRGTPRPLKSNEINGLIQSAPLPLKP